MDEATKTEVEDTLDEETLLQKHRKEKKDLQAKIQSLKKSICKGDKKKRKDVLDQIASLETALSEQHEKDLAALTQKQNQNNNVNVQEITESVGDLKVIDLENGDDSDEIQPSLPTKMSKTQRRRERKAAEFKERQERIAREEESEDKTSSAKYIETEAIKKILKAKGLMIKDVPSDGDCMYSAVRHQLKEKDFPTFSIANLRVKTSDLLRSKSSEFLPYLCHQDTGLAYSLDEYNDYCDKVAGTNEWGTQVELRALSHALTCGIEVVQATGPPLLLGEEYVEDNGFLTITFHRHMYQLGAHYNSVTNYVDETEDADDF